MTHRCPININNDSMCVSINHITTSTDNQQEKRHKTQKWELKRELNSTRTRTQINSFTTYKLYLPPGQLNSLCCQCDINMTSTSVTSSSDSLCQVSDSNLGLAAWSDSCSKALNALHSWTGIEGPPVSSLNCDKPLNTCLKVPELVMDAGRRDNRWTASLCTWPPGRSTLVV